MMKKVLAFAIVLVFFAGVLVVPIKGDFTFIQDKQEKSVSALAEGVSRNIRIAVYDESNTTAPAWSFNPFYNYVWNYTADFLSGEGFQVDRLTTNDILNHELQTANYDVFVMIDNVPRETITNEIYEYWLGGGAILSFNAALGYLCYSGILVPEWAGADFWGSDWVQIYVVAPEPAENHTAAARHSIAKAYHPGDLIVEQLWDSVVLNSASLLSTSSGSEMTMVTELLPGTGAVMTLEPTTRAGGRIVQMPGNGSVIAPGMESIIVDSINWLAPKPKGRIVFDLSHQPRLAVDPWDVLSMFPERYFAMRNNLEMLGYTFDKLYPSPDGNLTMSRLSEYDMLILVCPDFNYTASEISAVTSWVNAGGGLMIFGESTIIAASFVQPVDQINSLLADFDLSNNDTADASFLTCDYELHPVDESCSSIYIGTGAYVNITGDAFPLVTEGGDVFVAGQEYGQGRVILSGDMNWATYTQIVNDQNERFATNIANWLTASRARVLVYTNDGIFTSAHSTAVAAALNDLGVSYYIASSGFYFNLTLRSYEWDLVVVDSPWGGIQSYLDDINWYLDSGGKLIMSWFGVNLLPDHPLWSRIGFGFTAAMPGSAYPEAYIWNDAHGIFNMPNGYGATNFTPIYSYGDSGDYLEVYSNATAIAGFNQTAQAGIASIVLGLGGKVLFNALLIDEYRGDLDDSTYVDNFELWENEIAFMLRPDINHPADVEYVEGTTGHNIQWQSSSEHPWRYYIWQDSELLASGYWDGGQLSVDVDGLNNGTYVFDVTVYDTVGYSASDSVSVAVNEPPTSPTTTTTPPPNGIPLDPTTLLILIGGVGAAILIGAIVFLKKRGKE
jgi:hypothetical protein